MNTTAATAIVTGLAIISLPLSACGAIDSAMSTTPATVGRIAGSPTPLSTDADATAPKEWAGGPDGTGMFAVGAHRRDGLVAIPQGRYEVKVAPNARGGNWMLCDDALCGPAYQDYATVTGHAIAPYASTIYIGPRSRTLWVDNLILSPLPPISVN